MELSACSYHQLLSSRTLVRLLELVFYLVCKDEDRRCGSTVEVRIVSCALVRDSEHSVEIIMGRTEFVVLIQFSRLSILLS